MKKTITVKTSSGRFYYRIEESNGTYYVYDYSKNQLGKARSMEDALEIAKSHVDGSIHSIDIE